MRKRVTLTNMLSGLLLQIATIISGFIVPRIILSYFGSDVNGLVSSINQFLTYITLVEGGVSGVIAANLYHPLVSNNAEKLSAVMVTAKKFFRQVGFLFLAYSVVLSILYPILFNIKFGFAYTCSLVLILSISLSIQYIFSLSLRTLLNADKKAYIVNITQVIIITCNIIMVYLSVKIYPSIHFLKFISGALFILQPLVFNYAVNKFYDIDLDVASDGNLIKERWNGFAINIAAFIHNCTDVSLLTIFSPLEVVSVYSVHALVTNGLKSLINSVTNGLNPTLGQAYAKGDFEEVNEKLDLYEYIVFVLVGVLFSLAGLLITSFVSIYTHGITDADYYQPFFASILVLAEGLYLVKFPHLNLAYAANKFKNLTIPAFVEASINIVLSLLLIRKFGLEGVAIGTLAAMIYRLIFHINYTSKIVKGRHPWIFYKKFLLFSVTTIIGLLICVRLFPIASNTILGWLVHALLYSVVIGVLYMLISMIFFRKELNYFKAYIFRNNK